MKKRRPDPLPGEGRSAAFPIHLWLNQAAPILLVIGAWLAYHPYWGIVHDGRLYAAQALRALHPEIFDRDLFFAFGSQDDFTLFTQLFAPAVEAFGLTAASMAVVALGHALWLSGAAALALRLAENRLAACAGLLLLAALPASYGGFQVLSFGEGFATPRILAEGFGLWALWALIGRRLAAAAALTAASALLHPIMCATVLLAGLLYLSIRDRRWIAVAVAGAAGVAAGAYFGIAPFDRLFATMDVEWFAVVEERNAYLFPGLWRHSDWCRLAIAAAFVLGAAAASPGWRRSLLLAVAGAGAVGLAGTYVGADLLHNVFAIQLQLFRAIWLLHVVGFLAAGILLVRIWRLREDGHALVALLAFGTFVAYGAISLLGTAVVVAGLIVALLRLDGRLPPLRPWLRLSALALAALMGAGFLAYRAVTLSSRLATLVPADQASFQTLAYVTVLDSAVLAVATLLALRYRPSWTRASLVAVACVVFFGSLAFWDRRDDWARATTAMEPAARPHWALPVDTQVFWEGDAVASWLVLNRASYVSTLQGAGIAFARDTAITYQRRIGAVQPLMQMEMVDIFRQEKAAHGPLPDLDRAALTDACESDSALDAMVLSRAVAGSYAAAWDAPTAIYDGWAAQRGIARPAIRRFYLYLCDDLLRSASARR